jgi:hypothetical protein
MVYKESSHTPRFELSYFLKTNASLSTQNKMSMFINLLKKLHFIDEEITETDEVPVLSSDSSQLPPDVNFISPRILVIPYPSENKVDELATYFNISYKNKYMVWNLSEYLYNPERFDNQVIDC